MLQGKWLDVVFFYVRALATRYPFETAQQPLISNFNNLQIKASLPYAVWLIDIAKIENAVVDASAKRCFNYAQPLCSTLPGASN